MEKILSLNYVKTVFLEAERKGKSIDLSGATIERFILTHSQIKVPVLFKNAKILGEIYFHKVVFDSEVNFEGASVGGTFFLSDCEIKENLNCKKISVGQNCNLVGSVFRKNVDFEGAQIMGFLSLSKTKIEGKVHFKNMKISDFEEKTGKIVGNFYFDNAIANEIIIENAAINGSLNLYATKILRQLEITNTAIKKEFTLSHKEILKGKIKERKKTEAELRQEWIKK